MPDRPTLHDWYVQAPRDIERLAMLRAAQAAGVPAQFALAAELGLADPVARASYAERLAALAQAAGATLPGTIKLTIANPVTADLIRRIEGMRVRPELAKPIEEPTTPLLRALTRGEVPGLRYPIEIPATESAVIAPLFLRPPSEAARALERVLTKPFGTWTPSIPLHHLDLRPSSIRQAAEEAYELTQRYFADLPPRVAVFRGGRVRYPEVVPVSRSPQVALHFASPHAEPPLFLARRPTLLDPPFIAATIPKRDILAGLEALYPLKTPLREERELLVPLSVLVHR